MTPPYLLVDGNMFSLSNVFFFFFLAFFLLVIGEGSSVARVHYNNIAVALTIIMCRDRSGCTRENCGDDLPSHVDVDHSGFRVYDTELPETSKERQVGHHRQMIC